MINEGAGNHRSESMITLGSMIKAAGRGVFSVGSQQTVFEALEFMADKNIGAVLVIDDGVLAGIFSERDYARKVVLEGRSSQKTLVRDVMVSKLITIEAQEPLDRCMQLMRPPHSTSPCARKGSIDRRYLNRRRCSTNDH